MFTIPVENEDELYGKFAIIFSYPKSYIYILILPIVIIIPDIIIKFFNKIFNPTPLDIIKNNYKLNLNKNY